MPKAEYNTLTIEAAESGWIVKEKGKPTKVFFRWESLTVYLADRLTTKGLPEN